VSEPAVREECPHCDTSSSAFRYPLAETAGFHVVCDAHPLTEGHILVIPREHVSCIGAYAAPLFEEFLDVHAQVEAFLASHYGAVATFEHGRYGQTVFHSHLHLLPFSGRPEDVVPEGPEKLTPLDALSDLRAAYERAGGYLYFSLGRNGWLVDLDLAAPRFFRDRFAAALGRPERGNWKSFADAEALLMLADAENASVQRKWRLSEEPRSP
jgi:diadenosine tetraphosphate (Ap4A) HIT family hydrolase